MTQLGSHGPELRSDVAVEFRHVGAWPAFVWIVSPWLIIPLLLASGFTAIWLRANARGRGDLTAVVLVALVVIGAPMLFHHIYSNTRGWRGVKLCRVVPPVSMLRGAGATPSDRDGRLIGTAPMHLLDGRLMIKDVEREYALVGAIAKVQIGVFRKRWCCYAVFTATAGGATKRVHAFGRIPKHLYDVFAAES